MIKEALGKHKRVLYLLPEIALTTQLINRLRIHFTVAVSHSRFSPAERLAAWRESIQNDESLLIIGARSALFMPLPDLGLIIVDEEHESSYKQYEPSPRYHARDTAVWMSAPARMPYSPGIRYTKFGQLFQCAERPISSCVLVEAISHCAITGIRGGRYARSEAAQGGSRKL